MWLFTSCLALMAAGLLLAEAGAASPPRTLYVSTAGRDSWSGTLPAANRTRTDGPFAALERARDAIRQARAQGSAVPTTVLLRGGVYRMARPFVLRPDDSGTERSPVTYANFGSEEPVLSGGVPITGWRRTADGLWSAPVPAALARGGVRQLFVNRARRERARWPAKGWFTVAGAADHKTTNWAASLGGRPDDEAARRSFRFRPGDIRADWAGADNVEVVVLQFWMAARLRIQAVDEASSTVLFTGGSWRPLTWSFGYYVDNAPEGLATPGAWRWDAATRTVLYRPMPGEAPDAVDVIAPLTEELVRIEGRPNGPKRVHDITFRGITLSHTGWTLPAEGYAFTQAELGAPSAVTAVGAERCRFERCKAQHLGGWAIDLGRGCRDNSIVGCDIGDVGAGCVKVGEAADPKLDAAEACGTLIADNRLADGCRVYLGAPAVWVGQSGRNRICHNEITGQFMWAVSLGWNWAYFPLNRSRDNIVERNLIHDLGTGTLGTHGALYCLGISPGTVLRGNLMQRVHATEAWGAGEGIILDNGCSGILVEDNVVVDAVSGGWGCNFNCYGNVIQNNIFVNGRRYQLTRYGDAPDGPPPPNGEVFARNIVVWRDGPLFNEKDWWSFATLWNCNLYWRTDGEPVRFMRYSFDEWKAKGLDRDSLVADPLFVAPEKGDYRLKPGSPALRLGFRPIDLRGVGPRKPGKAATP
jgi:hypothetical protein